MAEINKVLLLEFIKALESGNYRQTRGALHRVGDDGPCFCATGVACDLFRVRLGLVVTINIRHGMVGYEGMYHGPPSVVKDALPINWDFVMRANDNGKSFEQIAALLREEYLDA